MGGDFLWLQGQGPGGLGLPEGPGSPSEVEAEPPAGTNGTFTAPSGRPMLGTLGAAPLLAV